MSETAIAKTPRWAGRTLLEWWGVDVPVGCLLLQISQNTSIAGARLTIAMVASVDNFIVKFKMDSGILMSPISGRIFAGCWGSRKV